DRRSDVEHLAHAGPANRALVADHDDVTRPDLLVLDGAEALLLGLEDPRGPGLAVALGSGELHHRSFGRDVAAQNRQAAFGLQRIAQRAHDLWASRRLGGTHNLTDRLAGHRDRTLVQESGFGESAEDQRDTARR